MLMFTQAKKKGQGTENLKNLIIFMRDSLYEPVGCNRSSHDTSGLQQLATVTNRLMYFRLTDIMEYFRNVGLVISETSSKKTNTNTIVNCV